MQNVDAENPFHNFKIIKKYINKHKLSIDAKEKAIVVCECKSND